jgi:glutamate-1-semialdehyde aminotransferase
LFARKKLKKIFSLFFSVNLTVYNPDVTRISPMSTSKSTQLYRRALEKIPGGVNSPVRAWKAVGGTPKFVRSGRGSHIIDADEKQYIDFVGSWGPLILGHANGNVLRCLKQVAKRGTTFGAPTESEVKLAETVCRLVPSSMPPPMSAVNVSGSPPIWRNV